jgi:creatinine amidohydrolase
MSTQPAFSLSDPEVRYQMLRPAQIVQRREASPVAYIPLGNLEWHGPQNPLGADTLQAEGIAIRAAQEGGGLVLPPLWYFSPLHETTGWIENDKAGIARGMGLPVENFVLADREEQVRAANERYQRALFDILEFAEILGFKIGVLIAGHYPLIGHALAAVHQFAQTRFLSPTRPPGASGRLLPWAFSEPTLRGQLEENWNVGDHGAGWETSNMMALYPQTVDLSTLPAKGEPLVGVGGQLAPQDATPEQGLQAINHCAALVVRETRHRLQHPEWYRHPACTMVQGHWKREDKSKS